MAGIVGILAFDQVWNVSKFLYYSLVGLQHRGYATSGVALLDGKIREKINDVPPEDLEVDIGGWAGLGYAGTRRGYPVVTDDAALVIDGVIKVDLNEFSKRLVTDPESAILSAKGAFSLIALTRDGNLERIVMRPD